MEPMMGWYMESTRPQISKYNNSKAEIDTESELGNGKRFCFV